MTLYFIGLGLGDEKDITVKGLELVKKCSKVYLDVYTSVLQCSTEVLEKFYGKKIILASRTVVENDAEETILKDAKKSNVAFLTAGDPLIATTHMDLLLRAKKLRIKTKIIHNSTIISAIAETGLQLYKFGPATSIPFPEGDFCPETPYAVIKENQARGLHTLVLLDLRPVEKKFMSVNDGLKYLLSLESKKNEGVITDSTLAIGCARIGIDSLIKTGKIKRLLVENFGAPLHCIIIPGKLHFMEEEAVKEFCI